LSNNNLSIKPNAPRFHTLWQHNAKKRIFILKREDWDALQITKKTSNQLVKLALEQISILPLGDLVLESDVLASTAKVNGQKVTITIYRNDPEDDPTPVNVDTYSVWIGLPSYLNVQQMIEAATTDNDDNFSHYANNRVFLIKENPGNDHWLEELPREVYGLLSDE
jgi:hypothetical protein